jgi:uncharacterized protein
MPSLQQLFRYPVKSCAPEPLQSATIEARGIGFDRRWMIVDADTGRFITGREFGKLVQLQTQIIAGHLHLQAPDLPAWQVAAQAQRRSVTVWDDTVQAQICDDDTNQRLSEWLARPVQLVHMDDAAIRPIDQKYAQLGDQVSFADGFPLLLISTASIANLQAQLGYALAAQRFRGNVIIDADTPHAEDQWQRIRIGAVEFDVVKPCVRCVFTTVDHQTGQRAADGEPLRTLLKYRRGPKGVTFGMNLIPRLHTLQERATREIPKQDIHCGDRLEIIK